MMNMVDKLKDEKAELFFDRWKYDKNSKLMCKVILEDFTNPKEEDDYYIFEGCFTEDNYHEILPFKKVKFWFTKKAFDKAIIKVINFANLDAIKKYDLTADITRASKYMMKISEVIIKECIVSDDIIVEVES